VTGALSSSKLGAPVTGEVVLPATGTQLVVIGGKTTGGTVASGVFTFDTSSGTLTQVGDLATGVEDACGTSIAGQDVVFGGSSPGAVSTVQGIQVPAATPSAPASLVTATVLGQLPQPRTDEAEATIGSTTYLVGGDSGTGLDPQVLATADGRSFVGVATLAEPVQSAAVAAVGSELYVFGGQNLSATGPSSPLDTIQSVDPRTHRARIVGHLPEPLSGAAAVTVGGQVLVIGGTTTATPNLAPPAGSAGSSGASTGTSSSVTSPNVWWFNPSTDRASRVAQLPEPVSNAGIAVIGTVVWVIGGESNGTPVSAVQSLSVTVKRTGRR
jgi:N-acetylneuraminic acid mutarotase